MWRSLVFLSLLVGTASQAQQPTRSGPTTYEQRSVKDQVRLGNRQAGPDAGGDRDWRDARNYDYDRPAPGERTYYADTYHRASSLYHPRSLQRSDRVYRGRDDRYYCRRADGTTGLIASGSSWDRFDAALPAGQSQPLGRLIATSGGDAALAAAMARGKILCR